MNLRQALINPLPGYVPLSEYPHGSLPAIIPGGIPTTPTQRSYVHMYTPPPWGGLQSIINGSRAQASAGQTAVRS